MGLFDFLADMGNHAERAVAQYNKDGLYVDTCRVSDSSKPFETAVSHPAYNDDKLVIVELYDTIDDAKEGHEKWVGKMLNNPPQQLIDVSTATVANLLRAMDALPAYEKRG